MLGNQKFSVQMMGQLVEDNENVFFSPTSVEIALAMTTLGARGETRKQMVKMLWGKEDVTDDEIVQRICDCLAAATSDVVTIEMANRIYMQLGYPFQSDFLDATVDFSGLETVNFMSDTEAARKLINAWVEDQTHKRIKDLLPAGSLNRLTRMVLVNAVYFLANWKYLFKKYDTGSEDFYLADNTRILVPMMHMTARLGYTTLKNTQVLALPYADEKFAMVTFLPFIGTVYDVIKKLKVRGMHDVLVSLEQAKVNVSLPRFEITWGTKQLKQMLIDLGMIDAFGDNADFTGMSQIEGDISIDGVYHQAYVRVNEEGTEAAAATAVVAKSRGIGAEEVIEVTHDHPFLFAIVNMETEEVLFMGVVNNPAPKSES